MLMAKCISTLFRLFLTLHFRLNTVDLTDEMSTSVNNWLFIGSVTLEILTLENSMYPRF